METLRSESPIMHLGGNRIAVIPVLTPEQKRAIQRSSEQIRKLLEQNSVAAKVSVTSAAEQKKKPEDAKKPADDKKKQEAKAEEDAKKRPQADPVDVFKARKARRRRLGGLY